MTKSIRPWAVRYGTALAIVALALLVKLLLVYLIDVRTPFLLFYGPNAGTVPTSRAEVELPLLHSGAPPFGSKTALRP